MDSRFPYIILFFLFSTTLFCQDILFFKDSTQINNTDSLKPSKTERKIGDYIRFNVQAGIVINDSYCNKPTEDYPHNGHGSSESYSPTHNSIYFANPNINLDFLFGKSHYVNPVIGLGYLRSHGQFNYHYGSGGFDYTSHSTELHYDSKLDYINLFSGLRFTFGKHFYVEPLVSINIVANKNVRISGYSKTVQGSPYPNLYPTYTTSVTYYNNEKANDDIKIKETTLSLTPKLGYEGFIKNQPVGFFASYNYNIKTALPWWCIGLTFYPLKKLRAIPEPKTSKSIRLYNPNLSIETSVLINRGDVNASESPNNVEPTSRQYKTGYNFGTTFSHGKANYCKHIIYANFIQTQAELDKSTFSHSEKTTDKSINYYNYKKYNSTVYFLTIGTGIRLILLKRINFDNAITYNMPIYSFNKIKENEVIYTYVNKPNSYYLESKTETPIGDKTSQELFVKNRLAFMAKVSYEFQIKQNKFGLFCGWNYAIKEGAQWHAFGLIYYPFKKLR